MEINILVLVFAAGLCVGSFINCLVYRLNSFTSEESLWVTIRGVVFGRSFCPKCRHKLAWDDNIPLLSFIWLKGHCRYCHFPISLQYPLVELAAGILTLVIFNFHPPTGGSIFNLLITYILLAIFVSDWLYQTIPDQIVYLGIIISFFYSQFVIRNPQFAISAIGAAGFFWLLVLFTKGKGMGLGDVKLAAFMGLVLGWPKIAFALFLAFLTGAAVGVILIGMGKKRLKSHIPFGPFLAAATFISLF